MNTDESPQERRYTATADDMRRFIVWIASASFATCIHEGKNFRKAVEVYSARKKTSVSRTWIEVREDGATTRLLNTDAEVMSSPSDWWLL